MLEQLSFFLPAIGVTIATAVCALLLGLALAMLFMLLETSRYKFLAWPTTLLVLMLRGLPEILVVLFVYAGISELTLLLFPNGNIIIGPFVCGVFALSLLYGAYGSQTLRGALLAIPRGQRESGLALGMSRRDVFTHLILPQMWRHALPGLGNQWLILLKDTALVSLISVTEIIFLAQNLITSTRKPFTWYLIAAACYLAITLLSQVLLRRLRSRITHYEGKVSG